MAEIKLAFALFAALFAAMLYRMFGMGWMPPFAALILALPLVGLDGFLRRGGRDEDMLMRFAMLFPVVLWGVLLICWLNAPV